MKNKLIKFNKTKFDYICFQLGVYGLLIFILITFLMVICLLEAAKTDTYQLVQLDTISKTNQVSGCLGDRTIY